MLKSSKFQKKKLFPSSFELVISFSNIFIEKTIIFFRISGFRPNFCRMFFRFFEMQFILSGSLFKQFFPSLGL